MTENNTDKDINKYLFLNLVTMLSITAMQQLGKLVNPADGKAKVNLEAAQATIDTLDMLFTRTQGNLDNDEARLLKDTLATLKMNYVETREMQKVDLSSQRHECRMQNEKPQDKMPPEGSKDTSAKPGPQAQDKSEAKQEREPPKFHKSYD